MLEMMVPLAQMDLLETRAHKVTRGSLDLLVT